MKQSGALIASLALSACNAQGEPREVDYSQIEVPVDLLASDQARESGRVLFRAKCALCHGERADGIGVRRQGLSGSATNFHRSEWRASTDPRDVYQILSEGKRGTSMPAWPTLSTKEKWEVVAYVLSVAEDGP